jgi:hypothetical protein
MKPPGALAGAQAAVGETKRNANGHPDGVGNPVANVSAAVERGLYELDGGPEGAAADKHGDEPEAAGSGQWEGQCGEGYEVHELVAALGRGRRDLKRPEHGNRQYDRHSSGEGDVEVLAHATRVQRHQRKAKRRFRGKSEMRYVQVLRASDKLNIFVIKIIKNLLHTYDYYTGKYKILLNCL